MTSRHLKRAQELHREAVVADMHADSFLWSGWWGYDLLREHRPHPGGSRYFNQTDLPRFRRAGMDVQFFGVVISPLSRQPYDSAVRYVERMRKTLDRPEAQARVVLSRQDLDESLHSGRLGGVIALEGAHPIGSELDRLRTFFELGVRSVGLVHFHATASGSPSVRRSRRWEPLPEFGRRLVLEMNRLGMVVDLAHLNERAVLDAAAISASPVIVSHTGVREINDAWRNLSDDQIRAVAATGGVIGIILHPPFLTGGRCATVEDVVDHIDHVIEIVGADHVGFGTDLDGFIRLAAPMRDVTDLHLVTEALLKRGLPEGELRKVLGGNVLRVLAEVLPDRGPAPSDEV